MRRYLFVFFLFAFALSLLSRCAEAGELKVGDVVVSIPGAKVQVWRVSGSGSTLVDTLDLGTGGKTGGCAFDSTYRLRCNDFLSAKDVRFALAHAHATTQTTSIPASPQSIVFNGVNDFFIGHAGGLVEKYDQAGNFAANCTIAGSKLDTANTLWTDITSSGNLLFYTSGGSRIRKLDVSTIATGMCAASNAFNGPVNMTHSEALLGMRLLRNESTGAVDGSGGFIAATGADIRQLDGAGNTVQTYAGLAGEASNNWRAVWLDADGTSFWSVNLATGNLFRFRLVTSTTTAAKLAGPIATGATTADDVGGITVEGAFSAAQPAAQTQTLTFTPASASASAEFFDVPACCSGVDPNRITFTLNNLTGTVALTVRFTEISPDPGDPDGIPDVGTSDTGLPCALASQDGTKCVVYEVEAALGTGATFSSADLYVFSPQTPFNPAILDDFSVNFTAFVIIDEGMTGGTRNTFGSVFSEHEVPLTPTPGVGTLISCGYNNPITDVAGSFVNPGSALVLKFNVAASTDPNCLSPLSLGGFSPPFEDTTLVRLNRLVENGAPHEETPPNGTTGNSPNFQVNPPAVFYRLGTGSKTLIANVDTTGLPVGCYVAWTQDLVTRFPSFSYSQTTRPFAVLIRIGVSSPEQCPKVPGVIFP